MSDQPLKRLRKEPAYRKRKSLFDGILPFKRRRGSVGLRIPQENKGHQDATPIAGDELRPFKRRRDKVGLRTPQENKGHQDTTASYALPAPPFKRRRDGRVENRGILSFGMSTNFNFRCNMAASPRTPKNNKRQDAATSYALPSFLDPRTRRRMAQQANAARRCHTDNISKILEGTHRNLIGYRERAFASGPETSSARACQTSIKYYMGTIPYHPHLSKKQKRFTYAHCFDCNEKIEAEVQGLAVAAARLVPCVEVDESKAAVHAPTPIRAIVPASCLNKTVRYAAMAFEVNETEAAVQDIILHAPVPVPAPAPEPVTVTVTATVRSCLNTTVRYPAVREIQPPTKQDSEDDDCIFICQRQEPRDEVDETHQSCTVEDLEARAIQKKPAAGEEITGRTMKEALVALAGLGREDAGILAEEEAKSQEVEEQHIPINLLPRISFDAPPARDIKRKCPNDELRPLDELRPFKRRRLHAPDRANDQLHEESAFDGEGDAAAFNDQVCEEPAFDVDGDAAAMQDEHDHEPEEPQARPKKRKRKTDESATPKGRTRLSLPRKVKLPNLALTENLRSGLVCAPARRTRPMLRRKAKLPSPALTESLRSGLRHRRR
jgi:hypothetical protein